MLNIAPLLWQVFPDLSEDMIQHLATVCWVKHYPIDTILCHENQHEETFYVIMSGEVMFSKQGYELRRGREGAFFGEMALLDEAGVRSVTVTVTEPLSVIEIERSVFLDLVHKMPSVLMAMSRIIVQRMRENDAQAIAEIQAQKEAVEKAYVSLQKLDRQRQIFLTTLAHELRTPLTSVTGYMQLVRSGIMTGPALALSLEKIGLGLDRMVSLINDLFFLQEMETIVPRFNKVRLNDLLDEVVDKYREKAEHQRVELVVNIPADMPEMMAEQDGLIRAFGHLIDNAIKFSPEGGEVILQASRLLEEVIVEVIDHGVGISPEFMPLLYDRFEREERYGSHLFDGTGLGMPIVKQMIESHAGKIEVASERGKGTRFTVTLPIDADRATSAIKPLSVLA